jgi:hypothetical protein
MKTPSRKVFCFAGEVGLSGKSVQNRVDQQEAEKLGFRPFCIKTIKSLLKNTGIKNNQLK